MPSRAAELFHVERRRAHADWVRRGGEGRYDLADVDVSAASLRGVTFERARFVRCVLDGSAITYSDLTGAELVDCSARRTAWHTTKLYEVKVHGVRFDAADLRRASFWRADVRGCDFSDALFIEGCFVRSELRDSCFRNVRFLDAQLDEDRFVGCDLRGADLEGGTLLQTTLEGCDLRGANLEGRRLERTRFVGCRLAGLTGRPVLGADVVVEACDTSEAGDGSALVSDLEALSAGA